MQTPFAFYDPDSSSWRTSALSLVEEWGEFSETWPRSGMTRDGSAYELPTPALRTDVSGSSSSLLPTPTASDTNGPGEHGTGGMDLRTTVSLLPTPTTRDHKGPNQRGDETCLHGALLPTPKATDGTKGGPNQRGSSGDLTLPSAVQPERLLPTPQAADSERGSMTMYRGEGNPTLLGAVQPERLLLPTLAAHDSGNTPENHLRKKPGRTQVTSLQVIVDHGLIETGGKLLPTPTAGDAKASRNSTVPRAPESTANIGDTLTDAVTVLSGSRTRAKTPTYEPTLWED